ncbi:MAG: hypothetical protein JWM77_842 [Rhodospirillales bacterium]|nr:hypothetical protein [Rhodospirillales bacterium]
MPIHKPFFTAVVILWAAAAFASASALSRTPAPILIAAAPDDAANPYAGITRTSLSDAVAKIEEGTGGRIVEIRWLHGPGQGYEAVVSPKQDAPVIYMRLNPLTAQLVTLRLEALPQWMVPWKVRQDVKTVWQAKVKLADAIETAQQYHNGAAIHAAIAKPKMPNIDLIAYQMVLANNGTLKRTAVDAVTGRVIIDRDVELVFDPWTPEKLLEKQVLRD